MPIKLKPSIKRRGAGKKLITEHTYIKAQSNKTFLDCAFTEHTYIKAQSKKVLLEMFNHQGTQPKVKQKIRKEFDRRGIKLVYG